MHNIFADVDMAGNGKLLPLKHSEPPLSAPLSASGPVSHAINGAGMEHQLADSSSDAESSGISEGNEEQDGDEDGGVYQIITISTNMLSPTPVPWCISCTDCSSESVLSY